MKFDYEYSNEFLTKDNYFKEFDTIKELEYHLVGRGKEYSGCGTVRGVDKCRKYNAKKIKNKKHTVSVVRNSCYRSRCPICFGAWAYRRSKKATDRLLAIYNCFRKRYKGFRIHHYMVAPPTPIALSMLHKGGLKGFRQEIIDKLEEFSVVPVGGCCVVHFWKYDKFNKKWDIYPHLHILGTIYIKTIKWFKKTGWIYRNFDFNEKGKKFRMTRQVLRDTVSYELKHATLFFKKDKNGVSRTQHTLIWFGFMGYRSSRFKYHNEEDFVRCKHCYDPMFHVKRDNWKYHEEINKEGKLEMTVRFRHTRTMYSGVSIENIRVGHIQLLPKWVKLLDSKYEKLNT